MIIDGHAPADGECLDVPKCLDRLDAGGPDAVLNLAEGNEQCHAQDG